MMQQKALLFGDEEMASRIMESDDPKRMKWMGRKVRGLNQEIWDDFFYNIVHKEKTHKFAQDIILLEAFRQTRGANASRS